jgi:hypothetical protein
LWRETIRPAWKAAVEAGQVTNVGPAALAFEEHLLGLEDEGENLFSGSGPRMVEEEIYWEAGYGNPQPLSAARVEAMTRWGVQRRDNILAWAKASGNGEVRQAAERMSAGPNGRAGVAMAEAMREPVTAVDIETAVARTLFYRRVLGAWEFLLTVNERPALERLHEIIKLERTPLP